MREEELKQKIIEILKNKNYDQIIPTFSLEERIKLINIVKNLEVDNFPEICKSFFTKEEAMKLYESPSLAQNVSYVSIYCLPSEYKENLLQTIKNNELYSVIVSSFEIDELKIKYLNNLPTEWSKCHIIESFNSDELKEKYLKEFTNESIKRTIIKSFKQDEFKIKYIEKFKDEKEKIEIIKSIQSDDLKLQYLDQIHETRRKITIINSLKQDALKISFLSLFPNNYDKKEIINSFQTDDLKIPFLSLFPTDYDKKEIINTFQTDDLKIQYLNVITGEPEKLMIIEKIHSEEKYWHQLTFINTFTFLKDQIAHKELSDDTKVPIEIIEKYSINYNVDLEKLKRYILKFGYKGLRFLDNKETINLLQLPDEDFDKIIAIFDDKNLEIDEKRNHTIIESLLNREFRIMSPEIYSIFARLERLIDEKNTGQILQILNELGKEIPLENYFNQEDIETFMIQLISKSKDSLNTLHQITDFFIDKRKNEYVNSRMKTINEELNLESKIIYDKNFITKKVIATTSISNLIDLIKSIDKTSLTKEQIELTENTSLLTEIIKFKKSPKEYGDTTAIRPHLKQFEKLFTLLYQEDKLKDPTNDPNAKMKVTYLPKKVSKEFLLNVVKEINIEKLKKRVLSNEEEYQKLLKILDTYRVLGIDSTYDKLAEKSDVILDATTLSSLIENFPIIYHRLEKDLKEEKIKRINFIGLIEYANAYGSSSYKYSMLFGKEDYRLIISNPPSNAASATKNERLTEAVECTKKMYKRQYVTVPPIDKNITINNKEINVVVGNTSNMMNLTYGERTGACMRIGGAGKSLFRFCLENKNGFHIRFSDPKTNEFISRVSGFRNGNTVFLNQLRYSVSDEYNSYDLVNACQKVADMLIENSKNDEFPIHNVVISKDYAMENYQQNFKKQNLEVSNIKEGFAQFYSDVSTMANILATSSPTGELIPVELGPDKANKYPLQRDKIKYFDTNNEEQMVNAIAQKQIIDQLLKNVSFEDCNYKVSPDIKQCYLGEDWYLAIDEHGNYQEFIIAQSNNLTKAHEEINRIKEMLKNQKEVEKDGTKKRN